MTCKCKPFVYLAGPVAGKTWEEAMGWRRQAAMELEIAGFMPVLPLENEKALAGRGPLSALGEPDVPGCTAQDVFADDVDLLDGCHAIVANLVGASRVSIGTVWELGFAWGQGQLCIAILGAEDLHAHAFIHQSCICVGSFAEAVRELQDWKEGVYE